MTLYIDLILLENIIMNYIIILATGMICRVNIKHFRLLVASLIGAIYAILVYLVDLRIYTNFVTKILISICMIFIVNFTKLFQTANIQLQNNMACLVISIFTILILELPKIAS